MRAVRMLAVGRPLEMYEVDPREPGPGEVRVRVRAAGICHSDAHYRAGLSPMGPLPLTLGHEIAGVVNRVGPGVTDVHEGDRVALHYLVTCHECEACTTGRETFCPRAAMLGHHVDGGFAEFVTLPARNAVKLPDEVAFEHGAVMMCSSATALHALRRGRLARGERVAIFGFGGLGVSALQLARVFGAGEVFAVDIAADKLALARELGATPVDASRGDPVPALRSAGAIDVALEFVGLPLTMRQALLSLAPGGRAVLVGLSDARLELDPYREILGPEAELVGSNDHTLAELNELVGLAASGRLDLSRAVARTVPLEVDAINGTLDALLANRAPVRTVVVMG